MGKKKTKREAPGNSGFGGSIALSKERFEASFRQKSDHVSKMGAQARGHGDSTAIFQTDCRRDLLRTLEDASIDAFNSRSVFISYSGRGKVYFEIAKRVLESNNYTVSHGDIDEILAGDYITRDIIHAINKSACFFAIWSNTYKSETIPYEALKGNDIGKMIGYSPSIWMPFELGVAMAFDKPFRVYIEKGAMTDFIEKPNLGNAKVVFEPTTFERDMNIALLYFDRRFQERQSPPTLFGD